VNSASRQLQNNPIESRLFAFSPMKTPISNAFSDNNQQKTGLRHLPRIQQAAVAFPDVGVPRPGYV
jgi:CMP-N-acetylneuraminic acid synthetase